MSELSNTNRIIRLKEVMHLTGLSRSTIYAFMADDKFPQCFSIGERAVGWRFNDVIEWIENIAQNNKKQEVNYEI